MDGFSDFGLPYHPFNDWQEIENDIILNIDLNTEADGPVVYRKPTTWTPPEHEVVNITASTSYTDEESEPHIRLTTTSRPKSPSTSLGVGESRWMCVLLAPNPRCLLC
jgi:hypothetical protein